MRKLPRFLALLAMLLLVTGCSPSPDATSAPVSTETAVPPTATQPLPTETPLPPSATPTPMTEQFFTQELTAEIVTMIGNLHDTGTFSGVILAAQSGEVYIREAAGFSDRPNQIRNTPETRHMIASLSKQFTAMGILILAQDGLLSLDDSVCGYYSDCPEAWQPITIGQLLSHTSGIPDFANLYGYGKLKNESVSPVETLEFLLDKPLLFEPGTDWSYSNSGYNLAGSIIEQVSGKSYADFLKENIFDPLGMQNSGVQTADSSPLYGYEDKYALEPAEEDNANWAFASGSLYATADDLFLWADALSTERLVPQELLDEMFSPQFAFSSDGQVGYGYGWVIDRNFERKVYFHPGQLAGFSSLISWYPEEDLVIIILSNEGDEDVFLIESLVIKMIFGN